MSFSQEEYARQNFYHEQTRSLLANAKSFTMHAIRFLLAYLQVVIDDRFLSIEHLAKY